ncbi:hypothetical protein TNCV_870491 [Trichonephila clavipes]|nr:hypothetical protein TNCV_870491 [Trichonephila clavipes]
MAALWRATRWYKRQHLDEEPPAKPFRVYVLLRHRSTFNKAYLPTNPYAMTLQDALFICYKQSPYNSYSDAFSQRSSSPRLIVEETCNDSDIMNILIDLEDGQEEPDYLKVDKSLPAF